MRTIFALAAAVCLGLSGAATASGIPALEMSMQVGTDTPAMWMPPGVDNGDGSFDYDGMMTMPMWGVNWDITADPDPLVNAVVGIQNMTAITQTFTFTVVLPVLPLSAPTTHAGSMQGGITDNTLNGSNATITTAPGSPLYLGMIDGAGVLPLYPDPYSLSAPFDLGSANIPAVSAGLPGITLPSGAVNNTIAIQHKFTLTAGDSATLSSVFVVIPEPGTISLLAFGAVMIARRRR